jgi:sporulation protein YlmC with PRC-barrel domain
MKAFVATLALLGILGSAAMAAPNHDDTKSGQFITTDAPDYYRASKLVGVDVYNDKNEKIGSISEVLVNRQGKAQAVVVGVGGFLGIGEHDVAVPFSEIQWENKNGDASKADYPEKAVLPGASKDELKNAPEFKYKS